MNTQELDKIFRDLKVDFNKPISLPVIIELMEEYGKRLKPLPDTEGVDWDKLEKEFMKENGGKSANDIETIAAYYNWISEWFKQKLSGKHIGEWIEVDIEKVPPMEVLCYNKAGDYMVGHLRAMPYNKFECEAENETLLQVTHYKSLTPPKQIV